MRSSLPLEVGIQAGTAPGRGIISLYIYYDKCLVRLTLRTASLSVFSSQEILLSPQSYRTGKKSPSKFSRWEYIPKCSSKFRPTKSSGTNQLSFCSMLPRRVDTIQHGSRWTTKAPAPTGLPVSHWKDIKTFAQIMADCARPAIRPAQNSLAICKARTSRVH